MGIIDGDRDWESKRAIKVPENFHHTFVLHLLRFLGIFGHFRAIPASTFFTKSSCPFRELGVPFLS